MKGSTAYNHLQRVLGLVSEAYSFARQFGMLSSELSKRRNDALATLPDKAPRWIYEYIAGWEHCMRDIMHREHVFCYTVNGVLFSTHRDRNDYYEKCGFSARGVYELASHSGHYWVINGELKPYFVQAIERDSEGNEIHKMRCRNCGKDTPIKDSFALDGGGYIGNCCLPTNE